MKLGFVLSALIFSAYGLPEQEKRDLLDPVCQQIKNAVSSATDVAYPGLLAFQYSADMAHWASSSSQVAKCSVQPGTAADVGIILNILGSTRTPFAVKGGGHASNPGFSSTTGVLIAMKRFSAVDYNASAQTATIGAGLIWDDVYAALAPHNVNVIGGRVTGVGVAGFTLGGGYSWKTNQYGLTVDSVTAYELVKPNGNVVTVTEASDAELFFGLKGGFNNFGIVTRFTMKVYPQTQVWGGLITITAPFIDDVSAATANFAANVQDPKAAILPTYNFLAGSPGISLLMFYDGPNPPAGIFDEFLAIPYLTKDVSTRDFLSLVKSSPANATYGSRGIFNTVPIRQYTPNILKAVQNESVYWGTRLGIQTGTFISYDVEPFLSSIFSHTSSSSPYPPNRSFGFSPFNIYFSWQLSLVDDNMQEAARQSAAQIRQVALADGQDLSGSALYPNYAIYDTALSAMYGQNVARLSALKTLVDPTNVMGLAGGFKF